MATKSDTARFAFIVEWLDPQAALVRSYMLFFYPSDNSVEMDDLQNRRKFLRRVVYPQVAQSSLFVGSTVVIHGRQLSIKDYADAITRTTFAQESQNTLAIIKPDAVANVSEILEAIDSSGFRIARLKMLQLSQRQAAEFYQEHEGKEFFPTLVQFMSSGPIVAMELLGQDAIANWRRLIGPTNSNTARSEAPQSLRAQFGTDGTMNACHGSDSPASAERETDFFFGSGARFAPTVQFRDSSCVVIKPSAVKKGNAGQMLRAISESGFGVTALELFVLSRANAAEFLEVYKGVVPEYQKLVEELASGPCIAAAVCLGSGDSTVQALRELVGPHDPELARVLRPNTLRAKFGVDTVNNAVHCTDLDEDAILENEYFFKILQ
jgi:nucleoside-diphosphate kinase